MGEAELSLLGTKSANPDGSGSTNVNGKGDNNFGFSVFAGYEDALSKQLMLYFGLGFNQYQTGVITLANSFDNQSISGNSVAIHFVRTV